MANSRSVIDPDRQLVSSIRTHIPGLVQMILDKGFFSLQDKHRARRNFSLQVAQGFYQGQRATLEVRKWRTHENRNRFARRLPALGPAIDVGSLHVRLVGAAKIVQMLGNRPRNTDVAL